jgi:NAD(P)-dependent dehydrogenase (short-subunit alcohol dehydrogenase family)
MKIDYTGKIIIVTGAASGIGRASTELFARLGGQVVATDFNAEGLAQVVDGINKAGGTAEAKVADVTDPDQIIAVVDFALEKFGKLDVLFNNAGGSFPTPMGDIDRSEFERIRALNFDAVYHACMRALPAMVSNGGGAIVSTTSGAGAGAVNGLAVYGAAKAGVNSLMRSIALEYGKQGIRANTIAPSTGTPGMIQWLETLPGGVAAFESKQPMGRLGRSEEIADVAAYLASDYASFINGVVIPVDGGIEAMLATPAN